MSFNKSVPTWLIVVVGLVVGIIFVYQGEFSKVTSNYSDKDSASTSSSPPAQNVNVKEWSVYKSLNNDYQVSYPKEWTDQSSGGNFVVYSKYDSTKRGKVASVEDISFSIREEKLSSLSTEGGAKIFNKLYDQPNGSSESAWVKLQNMSVGGNPAIKLLSSPVSTSDGVTSLVYLIKKDNSYYYLTFAPFGDESWAKNSFVVTFMVESFKFLSASNPSPSQSL